MDYLRLHQGKSLSIICSVLQWLRDNENNIDLDAALPVPGIAITSESDQSAAAAGQQSQAGRLVLVPCI